ncbi:hypothetical protein P5673_009839 [Acropora cervicornis]|uniref:Uncharacterized protein n=1 Tax=Acropora cervicornis TaxID=6130 RepID=A0AAD9QRU7_ACRCE|nr:hypothetical protein P5673_009839 [Acropora cervicornis]
METHKVKVKVKVVGRRLAVEWPTTNTSLRQAFAHHMPLTRPPMQAGCNYWQVAAPEGDIPKRRNVPPIRSHLTPSSRVLGSPVQSIMISNPQSSSPNKHFRMNYLESKIELLGNPLTSLHQLCNDNFSAFKN